MTKTIQIGDVFGDIKTVDVEDGETLRTAVSKANLSLRSTQSLLANSTSRAVSLDSSPVDNEVYLITSNQTSGH